MTRTQLALALGVALIAGTLAGWFRPVPIGAKQADNNASSWNLALTGVPERSSAAQFAALSGLRWVGDTAGDGMGGDGSASTDWTLRGLLRPEGAALVQVGTDPLIKRIPTGAILPDGSRLAAVERDSAIIDRDGCRTRRSLYPQPATDTSLEGAECITAGPDKETPQP
jgi:hypothetical protein